MATLSSILAWEIPWIEEPGRLQSMGSQRVRHDWGTNTHTHDCIYRLIASVFFNGLSLFILTLKLSQIWSIEAPSRLFPEKAMATHSSTLAWKLPWMEEPGGLQSMGLLRVGHDWATSLSLFTFMHCRRKWQPTPVFWPGESRGWGILVGCRLWGRTESDTTEAT